MKAKKIKYQCSECKAGNCKLWRQSHTFASMVKLLCATCAEKDQNAAFMPSTGDSIGSLIPAVPTEDGETFWGYTSVPQAQCNWWWSLPPHEREPVPIEPEPTLMERLRARGNENIATWTKETTFLVEATSLEHSELWSRWAIGGERYGAPNTNRVVWEQLNPGFLATVGKVAKMPVCVRISFARINGRIVAFYDATSRVVDHGMVEKWLKKEFGDLRWDNGTRSAMTNALNFHHCIDACREAEQRRAVR